MQLGVRRIGPPRPAAIAVPPKGEGWLKHYALAHDPRRGGVLYIPESDHHVLGPVWQLGDTGWNKIISETIRIESPKQAWTGFFDPGAGHVSAWNFHRASRRQMPVGVAIHADGLKLIETTGDPPYTGDIGFSDLAGLFAFDPVRRVTVCVTLRAIWELGTDRDWRRVWGRGLVSEWGDDGACATFDAPRGRIVFQVETDGALRLFGWDGTTVSEITRAGLPTDDYEVASGDKAPVLGAHPELGAILHFGGSLGRYALSYHGKRWRRLLPLDTPPPRGGGFKLAFDPVADGFVVGPGDFEPEPDEYPTEQQVFYVEGPLGWTRHGAIERKSPLDGLWSQKRFASIAGRWIATGSRTLQTFAWNADGWSEPIDKAAGEAAWKATGSTNLEVFAAGDRVGAVTMGGGVLELDPGGSEWRVLHPGHGELGTDRIDACVVFDVERKRVVLYGGTVNQRWSNRTYFYETGGWRPARRPSPRPKELAGESSPDYTLIYDTRLGRVLRFGEQTVAVLQDEQWIEAVPAGYVAGTGEDDDDDIEQALGGALGGGGGEDADEGDDAFGALTLDEDEGEDEEEGDDDGGDDDGDEDDDDGDDDDDDEGDDDDGAIHTGPVGPGSPRWCAYAHDPKTGINLVVSWSTRALYRVDLERCEQVGTFDLPGDLITSVHDSGASMFRDTWCFDSSTRQLRVQNLEDDLGHYALDLGPLFDRCAADRQAPWEVKLELPPLWLCLYRPSDRMRWRGRVHGVTVEIGEGPVESAHVNIATYDDPQTAESAYAEKLVAARVAGFVPVAELDRPAIERMVTSVTRNLRVAKKPVAGGAVPPARLGGGPGGVGADGWPSYDKVIYDALIYNLPEIYPWAALPVAARAEVLAGVAGEMGVEPQPAQMGFLFQIPAGGFLTTHAGVAVFTALNGRATEHNAFNEVRLLTHADLMGAASATPDGVPALPVFAIEIGPEERELDRALLEGLGKIDPGLVDRVEEVWGVAEEEEDDDDDDDDDEGEDEEDAGWQGKLGGDPDWVQSPVEFHSRDGRPYRFLLQLDVDELSDRTDTWDSAGLNGRLYIFIHPDEACAAAFWQYT